MYRVQAVSKEQGSFENRVSLCKAWRGLRDKELQEKSGFDTAAFVHHAGFIGGAFDKSQAVKMAELSLEEDKTEGDDKYVLPKDVESD